MNSTVPQINDEFKIHNYSDLLLVWHGLATYKLVHVTAAMVYAISNCKISILRPKVFHLFVLYIKVCTTKCNSMHEQSINVFIASGVSKPSCLNWAIFPSYRVLRTSSLILRVHAQNNVNLQSASLLHSQQWLHSPNTLGSRKMKGSAYSIIAVPTTAMPIPQTLHSVYLVHLAELCKLLVWPLFIGYKWVDPWLYYKVYRE